MNSGTPKPDDEARRRPDEADPAHGPLTAKPSQPDSRTSDEINRILASSLERPEPDPMLGGAGSWDSEKAAVQAAPPTPKRSRSGDGLDFAVDVAPARDAGGRGERTRSRGAAQHDWSKLILKSYASAVTLALAWVLWTGRGTQRPVSPSASARETISARRRAIEAEPPPPAAATPSDESSDRSTPLGKSIEVGGLEITPLSVLRKGVRANRDLDGETQVRDYRGCLVLTLRIKNRGAVELKPIDADDLRNGGAFIESPPGPAITMFSTGPRVGWTINDQAFPILKPGDVEDVILVSEPVPGTRLTSGMLWRLWVAQGEDRSQKVGVAVKFDRNDVHGGGG